MKSLAHAVLKKILFDYSLDVVFWFLFFRVTKRPARNGRINILVVNHVFDQDIEALERANRQFNFVILNAVILRFAALQLFPADVESYHVYNQPRLDAIKRRYRRVIDRFVRRLIRTYGIVAVIAPSDNFFYVREFIPALRAQNVPYYVLDKEGTICPAYFVHFAEYIKNTCPLIADHILVWSERQRLFWEKTGVGSDQITVVGQPRSDFWKQPDRWRTKTELGLPGLRPAAKLVLFFTYDPWAYTPDYMIAKGEMHWDALRQETHGAIFDFATRHPDIDVVIKAHPQQLDLNELRAEIDARRARNVYLSTGPSISNQLIVNADCVVGFQTTALIEAMTTDKPILYTFWGEARDKWSNDLIPFHQTDGVRVVGSPAELVDQLDQAIRQPTLTPVQQAARREFLREYLDRVDGHSSERALAAVHDLITKRRPAAAAPAPTRRHPFYANTVINLINTVISFVVAYAMTPIILNRMGTEDYGIWVFLGIFSITGYFSLLDFGLQGAAVKYIAEFASKNDRANLGAVVRATIFFFLLAGILGGSALFLFNAFFFTDVFQIPTAHQALVGTLVNVLAISFLFQLPALGFSAVIEGLQRYDYLRGVTIATTLLSNLAILLFLRSDNGLPIMVGITVLTAFAIALLYAVIAKRLLPDIAFTILRIERQTVRMLFTLSSKLFTSKIVGLIFNNTDKILIGIFLTVVDQTDYDIVNKLHIILLSIMSIFYQAVIPAASELAARNDAGSLRTLLLRSTKLCAAIVLPAFLVLMTFPEQLLGAWVGADFADLGPLVRLYCSHIALTMLVGVSSTMLVGVNKVGQAIRISIWAAILNLLISLATVGRLGIAGLILGTAVSYILSSIAYVFVTNRIFGIAHRAFFRRTVLPLLPAVAVSLGAMLLAKPWLSFSGMSGWIAVILLGYAVFSGVFIATGLSGEERQAGREFLHGFRNRLTRKAVSR